MNIFEHHLAQIKKQILSSKDIFKLEKDNNLKSIILEAPPAQFNFDLSCNAAMVLGKINKLDPKKIAIKLKDIFLNKIADFSDIEIAGPGFLNIKLSKSALSNHINSILNSPKQSSKAFKHIILQYLEFYHLILNYKNYP